MIHKKNGFSLIELITVIGIIAIISTLVIINANQLRMQSRDTNRVTDIKEIQTALEVYYNRNASYPTIITPGEVFAANNVTYIDSVPNNPTPRNDGNCGNNNYTYSALADNNNYELNFCLGNNNAQATRGSNLISKNGLNTAPGLVAWWKFEEGQGKDVQDVTGNNNTCTLQTPDEEAAAAWGGLNNCKTGLCIKLDGTEDSYFSCGTSDKFEVNSGSISLWFKAANVISGTDNRLVDIENSSAGQRISLSWTDNAIHLYGQKNGSQEIDLPSTTLTLGNWYYVVGTWNATGANIYINGAMSNNVDGDKTMALPPLSTTLYIGGFSGPTWNGEIDDVRIYDRAISESEIQAIYDSLK